MRMGRAVRGLGAHQQILGSQGFAREPSVRGNGRQAFLYISRTPKQNGKEKELGLEKPRFIDARELQLSMVSGGNHLWVLSLSSSSDTV